MSGPEEARTFPMTVESEKCEIGFDNKLQNFTFLIPNSVEPTFKVELKYSLLLQEEIEKGSFFFVSPFGI